MGNNVLYKSVGGGPRNSSIELFRILATFLVLIVHLNGYFIGLDVHEFNFHSFPQIVVEALSCVAVNGFILISGFFGVKLSFHTLWKLWSALFCIYVPLFILKLVFDDPNEEWNYLHGFLCAIFPFSTRDGYFVNGYIFLILASPFLNTYVKNHSRKHFLHFTIGLLLFEFWVDCICNLKTFHFSEGYSGLHFCLLYLVGQCIKLYYEDLKKVKTLVYLAVYVGMTAIIVGLSIFKVSWTYDYSNIFMIISAVSLFLVFAVRKPFYNNFINRIAQCSLFVYILQICSPFMGWLCKIDYYLLNNYTWTIYFILIVLLSLIFYLFCFVWDYARQIVTKKIFDSIESLINRLSQKYQSKVIRKKYI